MVQRTPPSKGPLVESESQTLGAVSHGLNDLTGKRLNPHISGSFMRAYDISQCLSPTKSKNCSRCSGPGCVLSSFSEEWSCCRDVLWVVPREEAARTRLCLWKTRGGGGPSGRMTIVLIYVYFISFPHIPKHSIKY